MKALKPKSEQEKWRRKRAAAKARKQNPFRRTAEPILKETKLQWLTGQALASRALHVTDANGYAQPRERGRTEPPMHRPHDRDATGGPHYLGNAFSLSNAEWVAQG